MEADLVFQLIYVNYKQTILIFCANLPFWCNFFELFCTNFTFLAQNWPNLHLHCYFGTNIALLAPISLFWRKFHLFGGHDIIVGEPV